MYHQAPADAQITADVIPSLPMVDVEPEQWLHSDAELYREITEYNVLVAYNDDAEPTGSIYFQRRL